MKSAPTLAAFLAMVSVQTGAAIGKSLFPVVGPEGVAALRLGMAALMLGVMMRPWQIWGQVRTKDLLSYGLSIVLMSLFIYRAFSHIPVSIAIAIQVTGPLGVALLSSRRPMDLLWIGLSLLGLLLLPLGAFDGGLDPVGVAYALGAALAWGWYLVLGARVSHAGGQAVATGMLVAALIAVPLGVVQAGARLLNPWAIGIGLCVAVLSSTIPFLLDIFAMRRLPSYVFGILLSASPAASAVAGWIVLHEVLSPLQCLGMASIMAACAGSSLLSRQKNFSE
jgi:inner membrane transporter RhtA